MLARACQPGSDSVPAEPSYLRGDKYTGIEDAPQRKIKQWCDSGRWWGASEQQNQQTHFLGRMSDRVPQAALSERGELANVSYYGISSHQHVDVGRVPPSGLHALAKPLGLAKVLARAWEVLSASGETRVRGTGKSCPAFGTEVSSESRSAACSSLSHHHTWCCWRQSSSCVSGRIYAGVWQVIGV